MDATKWQAADGAASRRNAPGWRDLATGLLVLALAALVAWGVRAALSPFSAANPPEISISAAALPLYTLHTTLRMLAALGASLVFTLTYATLAAKSRRAEMVLVPLLDVLQSVPVLGYLSFTVVFFVSLFPGRMLGPETAAVFAIFTAQAWNLAFSFYQSLRTIPRDLDEAAHAFRLSAWQRFWRLEVPFAVPGLVWNMMMSMSGGWFFVVASEAISVGNTHVMLPGVGSYVARAIEERDLGAVGWAILAMTVAIVLTDQLLFRPMVAWADKFRFEQTSASAVPRSWVRELFARAQLAKPLQETFDAALRSILRARLRLLPDRRRLRTWAPSRRVVDALWIALVAAGVLAALSSLVRFLGPELSWRDIGEVCENGALTLLRVAVLIALASAIWVPIGVGIGLRPRLAEKVQPLAQFLAAFPANLLFPIAVFLIVRFHLGPKLWLSPLMMLGTQWYILFNVVAGASAFPGDLREAAASFRVRGWRWWRRVMLPGIFPYYVTGAITASGGAWNASIVSEAVRWGPTRLNGSGLGAYIAQMTEAGDTRRVALGVVAMSVMVVGMNRLLWRPLYAFAERRTRMG